MLSLKIIKYYNEKLDQICSERCFSFHWMKTMVSGWFGSFGTARLQKWCDRLMHDFLPQNAIVLNIFQERFAVCEDCFHRFHILFLLFHVPFEFGPSILEPCDHLQVDKVKRTRIRICSKGCRCDAVELEFTWAFDSPNELAISSRSTGDRYFWWINRLSNSKICVFVNAVRDFRFFFGCGLDANRFKCDWSVDGWNEKEENIFEINLLFSNSIRKSTNN